MQSLFERDPYLVPYADAIERRMKAFEKILNFISNECSSSLDEFTRGWEKFGFITTSRDKNSNEDVVKKSGNRITSYREWAPNAKEAYLIGDFNNWNRYSHPMKKDEWGVWSVEEGLEGICHLSKVKISLVVPGAKRDEFHDEHQERIERNPTWIRYATQCPKTKLMEARIWNPPKPYIWIHPRPASLKSPPRIYEAHVGICTSEYKVASYSEFRLQVLPRICKLGYNCLQLMAIMEHAYYGSFGYQVTSFFAPSSRFGTPDDLKALIDAAHGMGICVFLDVVHSHASKNVLDGLNLFEGESGSQVGEENANYFHSSHNRGYHRLWDSRLFNYAEIEVLRFLLSNLRYWVEEFRFDGFRFDGVTSMLYKHHGIDWHFTGHYGDYFGGGEGDLEAQVYLMLANHMLHTLYGFGSSSNSTMMITTIAEDVSGMPAIALPVEEGGFGFDYRLSMGIPDMWIRLLKEVRDEDWNMGNLVFTLMNRRWGEKSIAYTECHDQALVGDKTIAFWLMDREMYTGMSIDESSHQFENHVIERGIALHKLIRLITCLLGGEGYLNFMGNEFGHPEWLDFPREGNGQSFHFARRQFHLADDQRLKYQFLQAFDQRMMQIHQEIFSESSTSNWWISEKHEERKIIAFDGGNWICIFNFHPNSSQVDFPVGTAKEGKYRLALCSDDEEFGGKGRVEKGGMYFSERISCNQRPFRVQVYIPARCALVLQMQ